MFIYELKITIFSQNETEGGYRRKCFPNNIEDILPKATSIKSRIYDHSISGHDIANTIPRVQRDL